jgi:hypothetical protein
MDNLPMTIETVSTRILFIRNQRIMIDRDLASLYGVETKRLNEQIRRNPDRFPEDFMFQLNKAEKDEVVANCDHLSNLKFSSTLPYAFTEHGAIMAATVLNSEQATQMSVLVVRAFVRLRHMLIEVEDLKRKVEAMEVNFDERFQIVFEALNQLMQGNENPSPKIGF